MEGLPDVFIRTIDNNLLDDSKGKYVIVEFLPFQDIQEMTIEAIPGYWLGKAMAPFICQITGKNGIVVKIVKTFIFAYVPFNQNARNVKKSKLNNTLPDPVTWIKWPVNYVLNKLFDNYQNARQEEVKVEAYPHSDLEGYFCEEEVEGRIKRNKKKWPGDTSSQGSREDSDFEEGEPSSPMCSGFQEIPRIITKKKKNVNKKASDIAIIPSPPPFVTNASIGNNESAVNIDIHTSLLDNTSQMLLERSNPSSPTSELNTIREDSNQSISIDIHNTDNTSLMLPGIPEGLEVDLAVENIDLLNYLREGETNDNFYKACFLRLLNQNCECQKKIEKLEDLLVDIKAKLNLSLEGSEENLREMKNLIRFPLSTLDELKHFNNTLKGNCGYFSYLRNFMTDCCPVPNFINHDSKTVKQELHRVVGQIFPRIIGIELALTLNMCGRHLHKNTPKKVGIKQFSEFLDVTYEAIKPKAKLANFELDRSQVESAVGEWLRLTKNRLPESKEQKKKMMADRRAKNSQASDTISV